ARVPVDAEEGTTARPRVGAEVRTDLLQPGREGVDERQRRIEQLLFVAVLVGRKPLAVVVRAQIGEEREELGPERRLFRRHCHDLTLERTEPRRGGWLGRASPKDRTWGPGGCSGPL